MPIDTLAPRGARRSDARLKTNVMPVGAARSATPAAMAAPRGARRSDVRLKTNVGPVGARRSDARLKTAIAPLLRRA
jgi:hypothetical protein